MTLDEIIKLARKAGFRTGSYTLSNGEGCVFAHPVSFSDCIPELERFAAMVAAAEREECAKVCDAASEPRRGYGQTDEQWAASTLAERIRVRNKE